MPFPLHIDLVRRTEAKLGRKLPASYVAKMCEDNGGEIEICDDHWSLYPIFDDTDRKRLKRTCNDILRETISAREWHSFPNEALAIGGDGDGDQLVLLAEPDSDSYTEAVYRWDHETGELTKIADEI